MSRYHSSLNNANNDLLSNCDQYLSKMMRNKKVERPERPRTEQSRVRDKFMTGTCPSPSPNPNPNPNNQIVVQRQLVKQTAGPVIKIEEPRPIPSAQELIHKEIFNNNMATVEVTVRTVPTQIGSRSKHPEDKRDTWDNLLMKRKSEDIIIGSFGNFDPLRTLHFLSKELQLKLKSICPGDPSVQQIVSDMQNAMQRLPPDVISQLNIPEDTILKPGGDSYQTYNKNNYQEMKQNNSVSQETQTVADDKESKKLQLQLEESANKLETSCKEMEIACAKLRAERDELLSQLVAEKETVKSLRKASEERISEKDEKTSHEIQNLVVERDGLKSQVKQLQNELESQVGPTANDLRTLIQELRDKQLTAEQENTMIRNELTIMKLERDKTNVLLECKDKQLRDIRNELESIQTLVSSQLLELKIKPNISPSSSISSISQVWNVPSSKTQKTDKSMHGLFLNSNCPRTHMILSNKRFETDQSEVSTIIDGEIDNKTDIGDYENKNQEIPNRDHSPIFEERTRSSKSSLSTQPDYLPKASHSSIKDMFAEIKRQAFMNLDVTLPSPPKAFKDVTSAESRGSESS